MSAGRMHPIRFGYCVPIFAWPGGSLFRTPSLPALDPQAALQTAILAEQLGYDSIWVADHLMLGRDDAILEGWTTLAAIAGATRRAQLGIIHQAHFFRHPAVAAKMIATLDQLSGGRFIFFADTGTRASEHHAYGLHYPDVMEERMPDFLEGLELILKLWQTSPAAPLTYDGRFYHVKDAVCQPPPVTQPHPPIWFGEAHALTLDACARLGQGWNSTPCGLAELGRRLAALKSACEMAGRNFDELEISYETQILIAPDRDGVRQALKKMLALTPAGTATPPDADFQAFMSGASDEYPKYLTDAWLIGTPAEVNAQLQAYLDIGVTHFMLWFMDAPAADGMQLFAEQVAPGLTKAQEGAS
jgi:alkanesulfonate monooxygenase SsuD/methylene tetrahydromethanopterin reductase-like flavin-dependent oxidoreductase (luciferase family)